MFPGKGVAAAAEPDADADEEDEDAEEPADERHFPTFGRGELSPEPSPEAEGVPDYVPLFSSPLTPAGVAASRAHQACPASASRASPPRSVRTGLKHVPAQCAQPKSFWT